MPDTQRLIKKTKYYNAITGRLYDDIWDLLKNGLWKTLDIEQFERNTSKGVLRRNDWNPVLKSIVPNYPGMEWDEHLEKFIDKPYKPKKISNPSIETVVSAANDFFKKFGNKKIGVQLSGGLDSSIIIGLLRHLKIPFYLIGMSTNRYEFRTERFVQQLLQEWAVDSVLIDYEQHLPVSNLNEVIPYQYPDLLVNNFSSENAMACECQRLGVEVLLTGDGGDNVFADKISENYFESDWLPQVFSDVWLAENLYARKGVELVSFYADYGIMDSIYNLRLGAKEDNTKLWARKFFKDLLPQELVNYTYCADFWGLYIDGLHDAIPNLYKLFDKVFHTTGQIVFSKQSISEILGQDLMHAKKELYQKIESRVALAVWIDRLIVKGIIS